LNGKLVAGTDISLTEGSGGGDETLTVAFTGTGKDIDWQAVQTSSPITGVAGRGYPINTTSGAITLNLPAGTVGDQITVLDYAATFDTNALTIAANGSEKIKGTTDNYTMDTERQAGTLVYVDATQGWVLMSAAPDPGLSPPTFVTATGGTITTVDTDYKVHTFTGDGTFAVSCAGSSGGSNTVDYMVVAGGGAGPATIGGEGVSGGGGGGGFRESVPSPAAWTGSPLANPGNARSVAATPYAITVGGGGPSAVPLGSNGSPSTFSDITSAGGGRGGRGDPCGPGQVGGSGGGGSNGSSGGSGNTPPQTPAQGTSGATGGGSSGAGGGGATAAGSAGGATAGNGGTGATTCISASPTAFSGGGGGGNGNANYPSPGIAGTGGTGGGAPGLTPASPTPTTSNGTANTGGGGGGASDKSPTGGGGGAGGAGGSGKVILRYKFQ
jgi:hypothetical protein